MCRMLVYPVRFRFSIIIRTFRDPIAESLKVDMTEVYSRSYLVVHGPVHLGITVAKLYLDARLDRDWASIDPAALAEHRSFFVKPPVLLV